MLYDSSELQQTERGTVPYDPYNEASHADDAQYVFSGG